jgi:hypothetical protein
VEVEAMSSPDDEIRHQVRPDAPDALGIAGRTVAPPLSEALYAIALEQSDEEVESADTGMWAGLVRDVETAADRVPETSMAEDSGVKPGDIDLTELSQVRASSGMIVTRDAGGEIAVRSFDSPDELAAAWSAVLVELAPNEPGAPTATAPDSDSNPA